ncbi:MAG: HAMP domain-containing protein [Prevotella sp.]|nr:HAMP domain-containing protein [Prevotella sp.]
MKKLKDFFSKKLSTKLSLMVVSAMALLLMSSLVVMLVYARRGIKEEAFQKARQTLEGTVQRIDNILLGVEQTTGNFYFNIIRHLDQPEMLHSYCRHLVEVNQHVTGCAIALKPDFYGDGQDFMAYYHRNDSTISRYDSYGDTPYTEQQWFTEPFTTGKPGWYRPLAAGNYYYNEPITTFCLPIYDFNGKPTGVISVDVSLSLLSRIILSAKPSPNSYSVLLDKDGSYIVHPDNDKLYYQTVFTQSEHGADPSVREAAEAMVSGRSGYKQFRMKGSNYYVFFTPFKRTDMPGRITEELKWSAGIVYPKDDILGYYNSLSYYVIGIAVACLLLLFLLCQKFIKRQLKPLVVLTESTQRISQGHYDETIPDSRQTDEIGRLQDNFQIMQQSLSVHIGELEELTATLEERGKVLEEAYEHARKADRLKTAFLHNMTNQMLDPAEAIANDVEALCGAKTSQVAAHHLVDDIMQNGKTVAELLNNLIRLSEEEKRKEGANV